MARLPDRDDLGRRPVAGVLQPIVSPNGAAPGRALQLVGSTLDKIGDDIYQKDAEAETARIRTALNQWEATAIHDPKTGAKTLKGAGAFKLAETLPQSFDDFQAKLLEGVSNKRARQAGELIAADRKTQVMTWTGDYVNQQREVYNSAQAEAARKSSIERVSLDPTKAGVELGFLEKSIRSEYGRRGLGKEAADVALLGAQTAVHAAVLDNLFQNQNYTGARTYFAEHSKELNADARDRYSKAVIEAGALQDSLTEGDRIWKETGGNPMRALEEARKIERPEVRIKTESAIRQRISDEQSSTNAQQQRMADAAWDAYAKGGFNFNAIPPQIVAQTDGKTLASILDDEKQKKTGKAPETDPDTYQSLRDLARDNPQGFVGTDLRPFFPKLAPAARESLNDIKDKIAQGKKAELEKVWSLDAMMDSSIKDVRLDKAEKLQLKQRAETEIASLQQAAGKELTPREKQAVMDRLLIEGSVPGKLWGSNEKRYFELSPQERQEFTAEIPQQYVPLIIEALRAEGMQVTTENMIDAYNAAKRLGTIK